VFKRDASRDECTLLSMPIMGKYYRAGFARQGLKLTEIIRLIIVDDEAIVRQGLAGLLSLESDLDVVGTAPNGAVALELAAKHTPDVVLMDIQMPVMDGIAATKQLLVQQPGVRILVLTTFDEDELVLQAMTSGAHGYLLKDCGGKQLAAAVRSIKQGFTTLARQAVNTIVKHSAESESESVENEPKLLSKLTAREKEVLSCLAQGWTNSQIAQRLCVTEKTVRDHVSSILGELGLRDRTQAALWAKNHL
jgi:DNA-binding NarL/FixJ family response regulator